MKSYKLRRIEPDSIKWFSMIIWIVKLNWKKTIKCRILNLEVLKPQHWVAASQTGRLKQWGFKSSGLKNELKCKHLCFTKRIFPFDDLYALLANRVLKIQTEEGALGSFRWLGYFAFLFFGLLSGGRTTGWRSGWQARCRWRTTGSRRYGHIGRLIK